MKLLKGLLVSFLVTYIVSLVIFALMGIGNDLMLPVVLSTAIFAPVIIIGAFILWGIPCHLLLNKFKSNNPLFYALAGFIPIPVFLALFAPFGKEQLADFLVQCSILGFIGIVGATTLWYWVVYKKS